MIKTYRVANFNEYIECVTSIANSGDKVEPDLLWFRGIDFDGHPLIPSLFRVSDLVNEETSMSYSKLRYAEDYRTQHYIAKNYHYFQKLPSSRLEWLEVMQHHFVKTRVLDWSESSIHSLAFAIESFISANRGTDEMRRKQYPCVWVLRPQDLNRKIFELLLSDDYYLNIILDELKPSDDERKELLNRFENCSEFLKKNSGRDTRGKSNLESMKHVEFIVNLSTIHDEIKINRDRLNKLLIDNEMFPIFFALNRIYAEGMLLEKRDLPPLAIVQPYHSERIKSQKGVFTVFPFLEENSDTVNFRKCGIDLNAMQYNAIAKDCLTCIEILNPEQMAYDIVACGINGSWLYPEMPIVATEIESKRIY